jgi:hypothetical protein
MSHFYGVLQGTRGPATRCGDRRSGITTHAASWNGAIRVSTFVDRFGNDCYRIEEVAWHGNGTYKPIAEGVFGRPGLLPNTGPQDEEEE